MSSDWLYISEHELFSPSSAHDWMPVMQIPPVYDHRLEIAAEWSAHPVRLKPETKLVRLYADEDCVVRFGSDAMMRLSAGISETFGVQRGVKVELTVKAVPDED